MAIKTIKDIIDSRGYVINSKDRAIFENGDLRSFFGLSANDAIEFIVYDVNNNELPQSDGNRVRYIPLTTENIRDYILIPEGTLLQKYSLPTEYFIDVERLLREAGYLIGIFKTQITLINKRAGSEMKDDKLYINEISPSRTEVRLFPVMRSNSDAVKQNLRERFNIFINDGNFSEDTISSAIEYVDRIDASTISQNLISKYGTAWFENLQREYKINNFNVLMTKIYNQFIEACIYEFTNKVSDINDLNYGKLKPIQAKISLSRDEIKTKISELLVICVNKYLPIPNSIKNTTTENSLLETIDDVQRVLQRKESDLKIDTQSPIIEIAEIQKPNITDKELLLGDKLNDQGGGIVNPPLEEPMPVELPVKGGGGYQGGGTKYIPPVPKPVITKPQEAIYGEPVIGERLPNIIL